MKLQKPHSEGKQYGRNEKHDVNIPRQFPVSGIRHPEQQSFFLRLFHTIPYLSRFNARVKFFRNASRENFPACLRQSAESHETDSKCELPPQALPDSAYRKTAPFHSL